MPKISNGLAHNLAESPEGRLVSPSDPTLQTNLRLLITFYSFLPASRRPGLLLAFSVFLNYILLTHAYSLTPFIFVSHRYCHHH